VAKIVIKPVQFKTFKLCLMLYIKNKLADFHFTICKSSSPSEKRMPEMTQQAH